MTGPRPDLYSDRSRQQFLEFIWFAGADVDALGRQPSVIPTWLLWLRANAAARLAPRSFVAYLARDVMRHQTPEDMR